MPTTIEIAIPHPGDVATLLLDTNADVAVHLGEDKAAGIAITGAAEYEEVRMV